MRIIIITMFYIATVKGEWDESALYTHYITIILCCYNALFRTLILSADDRR